MTIKKHIMDIKKNNSFIDSCKHLYFGIYRQIHTNISMPLKKMVDFNLQSLYIHVLTF